MFSKPLYDRSDQDVMDVGDCYLMYLNAVHVFFSEEK